MSSEQPSRGLCASAPCFHPRNPNLIKRCSTDSNPSGSTHSSLATSPVTRGPTTSTGAVDVGFPVVLKTDARKQSESATPATSQSTSSTSFTKPSAARSFPTRKEHSYGSRSGGLVVPGWVPAERCPPRSTASSSNSPSNKVEPYPRTMEGLNDEILDLLRYVALNTDEQRARQEFVNAVRLVATKLWSTCRVVPFGSFALGLSTSQSDVDVAVVFSSGSDGAIAAADDTAAAAEDSLVSVRLHALSEALSKIGLNVSVIDQCRVPVLQVYQPWSGLRCDVSLSLQRPEDVVCQQLVWLETEPLARPLIVLTKLALQQWELNCLFTGGISSTCIYSLVHRFLSEGHDVDQPAELLPSYDATTTSDAANEQGADGSSASESPASVVMSDGAESFPSRKAGSTAHETDDDDEDGGCSMSPCETSDAERDLSPPQLQTSTVPDGATLVPPPPPAEPPRLYSATVAEMLLQFWRYCGADLFHAGYYIEDAFHVDQNQHSPDSRRLRALPDLSKGSFRLGEAQFLFQHSAEVVSRMMRPYSPPLGVDQWLSQGLPVTTLSAVFADPRIGCTMPRNAVTMSSVLFRQRQQQHAPPPPPPAQPQQSTASSKPVDRKEKTTSTPSASTESAVPRGQVAQNKRKRPPVITH